MNPLRVVIITGLSGSGKSTALRALEDLGFFCVDNLPLTLLPRFLKIQSDVSTGVSQVALVMDLRQKRFLEMYHRIFSRLKHLGYTLEILFLDASDEALLNRFSETRRVHPLSVRGSVMEGIKQEREKLAPLKKMADKIIDTTSYNIHQLKDVVQRFFSPATTTHRMILHVTSFGYKYGVPTDADIIMDVRFLPNPYFVDHLKQFDGHHPEVCEYVLGAEEGKKFVHEFFSMMEFLIPLYEREGKARLNVAFGCTGGRHRSVVMANIFTSHFTAKNYVVTVNHRDIQKA